MSNTIVLPKAEYSNLKELTDTLSRISLLDVLAGATSMREYVQQPTKRETVQAPPTPNTLVAQVTHLIENGEYMTPREITEKAGVPNEQVWGVICRKELEFKKRRNPITNLMEYSFVGRRSTKKSK